MTLVPASVRAAANPPAVALARVASVDTVRGLVVTLMIFVNDAAGISRAPSWLKHVRADFDGMTLPDVVFPAFLFIAGVSIPLSLGAARTAGVSSAALMRKVLGRVFALLVMGVMMVSLEEYNPWWRGAWGTLAFAAMLLAFVVLPSGPPGRRRAFQVARVVGAGALVALALAYRTPTGEHLMLGPLFAAGETAWLRHSWWGILGLIGWAYLVAASVFLLLGRRREWLIGATALLFLLHAAAAASYGIRLAQREWLGGFSPVLAILRAALAWIDGHVSLGSQLGSLPAIMLAGCCLGAALSARPELPTAGERRRWAAVFGGGLLAAALLFDPLFGIGKIQATPTWGLISAAGTTFAWVAVSAVQGEGPPGFWARLVAPAGAHPLLAYLLHPFLFMLAELLRVPLGFYRGEPWPVWFSLAGSAAMALAVGQLAALIARTGYRLKV